MAARVESWRGRVYRHIPAGSPFGPLDTRFAARSRENRWNLPGEPTLYFGGDRGVLISEFGRHFREDRAPALAAAAKVRQILAIDLVLERVVDLRDPSPLQSMGLLDAPACFLDRSAARATAGFLRHALGAEAAIVPSIAFLDDPARWNLVLFLDQLQRPLEEVVRRVTNAGTFRLTDPFGEIVVA